jgi:hypothetical protein
VAASVPAEGGGDVAIEAVATWFGLSSDVMAIPDQLFAADGPGTGPLHRGGDRGKSLARQLLFVKGP